MEDVKTVKVYTFTNPNGDGLTMHEGWVDGRVIKGNLRFMFKGNHIPMPVRSGDWFPAVGIDIMLEWLFKQEWLLKGVYNATTGVMRSIEPNIEFVSETDSYYQQYLMQLGRAKNLENAFNKVNAENKRLTTLLDEITVRNYSLTKKNTDLREQLWQKNMICSLSERQLKDACALLCNGNAKITAIRLWRANHPCLLSEAKRAVEDAAFEFNVTKDL